MTELKEATKAAAPRISPARAWLLAARPATLTAAVAPVLVGAACALGAGRIAWAPTLAALLGASLIQIGTNFANDVFDAEKGADTAERLGPTRAVQAGLLSAAQVRRGMVLVFALALLCGFYLVARSGWPIVAIGLASIASGVAYTGGPYPLGYHGLGDVFVFAFFGVVAVCGTAFVAAGEVPGVAWLASAPIGALATAVLVVNNLRDRGTDRAAGKRTLAVRLGRRATLVEYQLLLLLAYAAPIALVAGRLASPAALLPLVSAPLAIALARAVAVEDGAALNARLAGTARLLLLYAVLFAAGLAAGPPG